MSGTFWFKDFGVLKPKGVRNPLKVIAMTQQKILPRLERLIQLLEESKALGQSTSTQRQQSSGTISSFIPYYRNVNHVFVSVAKSISKGKRAFGRESASRAWTESASIVKGIFECTENK